MTRGINGGTDADSKIFYRHIPKWDNETKFKAADPFGQITETYYFFYPDGTC